MATQINTRAADKDDLDAINNVVTKAVMGWQLPERVKRLSLSSYLYDEIDLQHLQIMVAVIDDSIIGVLALDNEYDDANLLIHGLFVAPEQQHKGIGACLFQQAEMLAQQQHCTGLLVRSHKNATGFFIAMGMSSIAITDHQRDYQLRYWKQVG